jgi:hypothetical protein
MLGGCDLFKLWTVIMQPACQILTNRSVSPVIYCKFTTYSHVKSQHASTDYNLDNGNGKSEKLDNSDDFRINGR